MSAKTNEWAAQAEALLMGAVIPIQDEDHMTFMVKYILRVLDLQLHFDSVDLKTQEVVENAMFKYNDENQGIKYMSVNSTMDFILMSFVRDDSNKLTDRRGVLTWVENITAPDCSELGYAFFALDSKTHRIRRIG